MLLGFPNLKGSHSFSVCKMNKAISLKKCQKGLFQIELKHLLAFSNTEGNRRSRKHRIHSQSAK